MALPRRRWTLRRRLILGIIALLAFVSIVIGTVSVLALQGSLMAKLDGEITAATASIQDYANGKGGRPGQRTAASFALGPGSLVAIVVNGAVVVGSVSGQTLVDEDDSVRFQPIELTTAQKSIVATVTATGKPSTIDLGGDLGLYRVAGAADSFGTVAIVGLPLSRVSSTVSQVVVVVVAVVLAGLAIAFFAGTAIVRLALRPLERVTATASQVSELPLDRGDVALEARVPEEDADPRTEVGQVGAAINRMLGHVASALSARESSERTLRTFVADASHELRTPLASIRGYSELTRRGGYDLPPDVVHALGRVESESIRMTSLVEDLLLLARLDDGRELEKNPVDLTRILADAVSDAHAASQDHEWVLDVPNEPVMVTGDAARLHQVVVNLLANARVHTPAGTRVVVAATAGESVKLTVTDNGPGIDPEILPAVFERFARGDSSRSRVAGSTGLGLAIVSAVVDAHAGTVMVSSEPGVTVFTVTLPGLR